MFRMAVFQLLQELTLDVVRSVGLEPVAGLLHSFMNAHSYFCYLAENMIDYWYSAFDTACLAESDIRPAAIKVFDRLLHQLPEETLDCILRKAADPHLPQNPLKAEATIRLLAQAADCLSDRDERIPEAAIGLLAITSDDPMVKVALELSQNFLRASIVRHIPAVDDTIAGDLLACGTDYLAEVGDDDFFRVRLTIGCRIVLQLMKVGVQIPPEVIDVITNFVDQCLTSDASGIVREAALGDARELSAELIGKMITAIRDLAANFGPDDQSNPAVDQLISSNLKSLRRLLTVPTAQVDTTLLLHLIEIMSNHHQEDGLPTLAKLIGSALIYAFRNDLDLFMHLMDRMLYSWRIMDDSLLWGTDIAQCMFRVLDIIWTTGWNDNQQFLAEFLTAILHATVNPELFGAWQESGESKWYPEDQVAHVSLACRAAQHLCLLPNTEDTTLVLQELYERVAEKSENAVIQALLLLEIEITRLFVGLPMSDEQIGELVQRAIQSGLVIKKYHKRLLVMALARRGGEWRETKERVAAALEEEPLPERAAAITDVEGHELFDNYSSVLDLLDSLLSYPVFPTIPPDGSKF
jgi:hypothetical protein